MNPTEALAALKDQVSAVFANHGLEVWDMCFSPDDGVLAVQITGGLASDAEAHTASESDGFDEVIASAREAEADQRRKQAIQDLSDRLHGDGGFLDT